MKRATLLIRSALLASSLVAASAAFALAPKPAKDVDPEGEAVFVPDVVEDKGPVEAAAGAIMIPDWTQANAAALLMAIKNAGNEGLFPADYAPDRLATAVAAGPGAELNRVATDTFLLYATHLRDGRTPNAARKQWFMVDSDSENAPLLPMLAAALTTNDIAGALASLTPTHASFAALRSTLSTTKDKVAADRIRVNMERWRWMPRDLGTRYILTNVPEYMTRVIHSGRVIGTHKAVVGKTATATPQLSAMATGIIINPTWTLPRSIIDEGIGATIANNPAAARAQGYAWTGKGKGLSVVQSPGTGNALGMMKLEMLNPHAIYLHDTPSKGAFAAAARAFSHGCIRTERALHFSGLMAVVFGGQTPEAFGEAYASGKTTRFAFENPFPVYIAYWTLALGADGKMVAHKDIYERDAPVVASFSQPGRSAAAVLASATPMSSSETAPAAILPTGR